MRRHGLVLLCTFALAAGAAATAGAHSNPQIRAQQARARAVRAQVEQIQRNLEGVIQQYDGAKWQLEQVQKSLQKNEFRLHVARRNFHAAQKRLMQRIYSLYVYGQPTMLDVLAGAKSISQLINRAESAHVLSEQDAALGRQALRFEQAVQRREHALKQLKLRRAAAVRALASKRQVIQASLAHQNRLLASIHTTIHQLQVQEAKREQAQRAAALARLRKLEAERRKRQQQQPPPASGGGGGYVPPPVTVPGSNPGVGHPAAAQIALQYLGVPYVWGGASPSGFDCSGLVMYVYAQLGISLPHYTVAQWNATLPISASQMAPGDLVFFDGLGHVGIYIGNGQFVDAPHTGSVVRIDSLAAWGGSFVGARRVP